jgi:NAD+ synthase (glutamine-hydrolysing)
LKVALAQINTTVAALEENASKIKDFGKRAAAAGAALIVYPELAVTGYPPRDFLESPEFIERTERVTRDLVSSSKGWAGAAGAVVGTVLVKRDAGSKGMANAALLVKAGKIVSVYEKALLPSYDVFDETRYFDPSPASSPTFFNGAALGLTICEDVWNDKDFWKGHSLYLRDPVAAMANGGMEALVNVSASPYALGKPQLREEMLRTIARKYAVPAVMVNTVGGNDSLIFDGGSMAFDAQGVLLAKARSFEEDLVVVDLDGPAGQITAGPEPSEEEMLQAVCLGLRDYVGKCGFKSVLVGISGGVDSAVTAVVAARALGPAFVHAVSMPSRYSSNESVDDAKMLASNLGVNFYTVPIEKIFKATLSTLGEHFDGMGEGVTEQNVQARIRGMTLMALSNKFGHLVLATGNKSEIAAGYCTLYGDMVGGLGILADIPKTKVYALARHINRDREVIPRGTIERPPTAELKMGQTDQDDLPPYEILDEILAAYIEERKGLADIVAMGFDKKLVVDVIRRVMGAEHKRRQGATVLKVTWKAFGEGRRFPIAHGYRLE